MKTSWLWGLTILLIGWVPTLPAEAQNSRRGAPDRAWNFLAEKYDADKDGKISKAEYDRSEETFASLDRNGDGTLSKQDWSVRRPRTSPGRKMTGAAPKAGDKAPDFELTKVHDADSTVRLSSFAGKKPVALIFGSCT